MPFSTNAAHLQHQIDKHLELAGLAPSDTIRAMHEDLEKLYRARLVASILAERVVSAGPKRLPRGLDRSAIAAQSGAAFVGHVVTETV